MREPVRDEDDVCWGGRTFVFKNEAQKLWLERCVEKGYTVPDWPKPYGGAGLSPEETKILSQEMKRIGARSPLDSFGIWMRGPALLKFGPEEDRKSAVQGKSVSVRVDPGGRRDIKKKKQNKPQ